MWLQSREICQFEASCWGQHEILVVRKKRAAISLEEEEYMRALYVTSVLLQLAHTFQCNVPHVYFDIPTLALSIFWDNT